MLKRFLLVILLLTLTIGAFTKDTIRLPSQMRSEPLGLSNFTIDLFPYWVAFQIARSGENPYDPVLFAREQAKYSSYQSGPAYFPPWTLLLLSPFFVWDCYTASTLFFACNILLIILASRFAWSIVRGVESNFLSAPVAGVLFIPALDTINYGQISLLVTTGIYGAVHFLQRKQYAVASLFLAIATLKPHIAFLFWVALGIHIIASRAYTFLLYFIGIFAALIALTLLWSPHIGEYWLTSTSSPLVWRSVSVTSFMRGMIQETTGSLPSWPAVAVPGLAIVSTVIVLFWKRNAEWDWRFILPISLGISAFTAPYIWIFDHSVLLILQVAIVARGITLHGFQRVFILSAIVGFQMAIFVLHYIDYMDHRLFWFPLPLIAIWIWAEALSQSNENKALLSKE